MEPAEYDTMARLEDGYWWYVGLRRMVLRNIQAALRPESSPRILDAACGTGGGMMSLSKAFPESMLVGVDISPAAVGYSARRNAGHIVRGSVHCLPFGNETFDALLLIDLLYIKGVHDAVALREAYRVLRSGGVLVVNVPAFECLRGAHDVAVHTRHRYRRHELQELLTKQGFTVNKLLYWDVFFLPVVLVFRRLLRGGRGAGQARSDLKPLPGSLNWLLTKLIILDTWVCEALRAPFGTSVFSVAFKRD